MGCEDTGKDPQRTEPNADKQKRIAAESFSGDIFTRGATKEQLDALRLAVAAHKAAQAELLEAAGVLWNSEVDAAMAIGGPHGASIAMSRRLNFFDNCACTPCPIVVACW